MATDLECPYCGYRNFDAQFFESKQGDRIEYECLRCKKTFQYEYESIPDFTVFATPCLNDENHKWITNSWNTELEQCELCKNYRSRKK